jgi:uncharacterized membrane protein
MKNQNLMQFKRSLFRDILRDTNSKKFSMTKFGALITIILLVIAVSAGIWIMIDNNEIDYFLIGELIALLLTLLGYKNAKDRKKLDVKKYKTENNSIKNDNLSNNEMDEIG